MPVNRFFFCLFGLLILLGNADAAGQVAGALATIASGVLSAGPSFLQQLTTGRTLINVNITIENWTRFPMTDPKIHVNGGVIDIFPRDVEPGTKEQMHARKSRNTATGSSGTVSWMVHPSGSTSYRIGVMWSVPYDYNWYSNWLAVGTMHGYSHQRWWFDQMYDDSRGDLKGFSYVRKEYWDIISDIVHTDSRFDIHATMGNGHNTNVKIEVRPFYSADLAYTIKRAAGLK